jgi:hypothetical protein
LIKAIISLGAVFTTGAGNSPGAPYGYPALFGNPSDRNYIPDLIVVGSVLGEGIVGGQHCDAPWLTCFAPGYGLRLALSTGGYTTASGTSYGTSSFCPHMRRILFHSDTVLQHS